MTIRKFTPFGIAIWAAICWAASLTEIVPVAPVAIVAFVAMTLIAFELEDGLVPKLIAGVWRALRASKTRLSGGFPT